MKYYKFELSMAWANVLSVILLVLGMIVALFTYGGFFSANSSGFMLFELLIYLVIHELLHGIAFSCFCKNKSNVKYGAMLEKGVLYAMCQERISKKGAFISLMAPTVVLTFIALIPACIFRIDTLVMLAIFNLSGAAGDLLMTLFLTKLPKDIQYIDYDNVIGFYLLSKKDLSKYNSPYVKYVESGTDSDKLINKNIKSIYISKQSWIVFAMIALVFIAYILV